MSSFAAPCYSIAALVEGAWGGWWCKGEVPTSSRADGVDLNWAITNHLPRLHSKQPAHGLNVVQH